MESEIHVASILGEIGSGTRSLAIDLARDPAIQRRFWGGIYWASKSMPKSRGPKLLMQYAFDVTEIEPGVKYLYTNLPGRLQAQLTVQIVKVEDLSDEEQDALVAPFSIPPQIRTEALRRIGMLARWNSILRLFPASQVEAWLEGRYAPAAYPEAERFARDCAVDLLPGDGRDLLGALAALGTEDEIPEGLARAITGSGFERLALVQSIGLLTDGSGIRSPLRSVRPLVAQVENWHRTMTEVAKYYAGIKGEKRWSDVPDDGYFVQNIARVLHESGRDETLRELLSDREWAARRVSTSRMDALLAHAALVGMEESVRALMTLGDHSGGPVFLASWSGEDEGVEAFIEDVMREGPSRRRVVRASEFDWGTDEPAAFIAMLSPAYVSDSRCRKELDAALESLFQEIAMKMSQV